MHHISAQDNDLVFFRRIQAKRCHACNALLDKWHEDISMVPIEKKIKNDASYSYDGILVVSLRFKMAVESLEIPNVSFLSLQKDFFYIRPTIAIAFDAARRGTRFEHQCSSCGLYKTVVGATPIFLKSQSEPMQPCIARTDIEFGSGDELNPLILCDSETARSLSRMGLTGLELRPIPPRHSMPIPEGTP
jgi:hypothetical protein